MRQFLLLTLLLATAGHASALDEDEAKKPPVIQAQFAVAATMRSYFLDIQALEPQWLYEKQIENWFPIQSHASGVAVVSETPQPIPPKLTAAFSELAAGDKTAENEVLNGSMISPQRAYLLFDSQRKPIVLIFVHFDVLRIARAHQVSREDTFQAYKGWESYRRSPEVLNFLSTLDPANDFETPFMKWKKAEKTPSTK